ncbi:DDE_Tnp_1-associated family protein [Burkholderia humptydooensis]|nr:DDE_Tnp_1-associated family protein [Burkholderia sp. 2002721687]
MPTIMDAFAELRDPRCRACRYPLQEILFAALCAVLCGVEDWETMTLWGRTQLAWLRSHLAYENGVPSPDTFRRVFGALSAKAFERCFIDWVGQLCPALAGQHVAIDGKAVRGNRSGTHAALHLVSAWCSNNGLSLGQVSTADKSNEITAIPELLAALDLQGATITIDAIGTQHEIARTIVEPGPTTFWRSRTISRDWPKACASGLRLPRTASSKARTGSTPNMTKATGGWRPGFAGSAMMWRG